jgi:hypothetical protein
MDFLKAALAMLVFFTIGNYLGDQATLKDCATMGQAKMLGGGSINCTVKEELT